MSRLPLPSLGLVSLLASWALLGAFAVWGAREPSLVKVQDGLTALELGEWEKAPDRWLEELVEALHREPQLAGGWAGGAGARILEPSETGRGRLPVFHVMLAPRAANTPGWCLQANEPTEFRVGDWGSASRQTVKCTGLCAIPWGNRKGSLAVVESPPGRLRVCTATERFAAFSAVGNGNEEKRP